MNAIQRARYNRKVKAESRDTVASHVSHLEDLKVIFAWETGNLTEGQASKALGYDRVTLRCMREFYEKAGGELARALLEPSAKTKAKIDAHISAIVKLKTKKLPGQ